MKPLWLEFSAHHMRSSLLLLTVKELRLAVSESITYQIQKMAKELLINTILTRLQLSILNMLHLIYTKQIFCGFSFFFFKFSERDSIKTLNDAKLRKVQLWHLGPFKSLV